MPPPARRHGRALLAGLALAALGVLAALLIAEVALRLGSRLVPQRTAAAWRDEGRPIRLLFLGDSNTFGVYVDPGEAFPRQLEVEWNRAAAAADAAVEVLNLGFPGTNSTRVREDLPRLLRILQPDAAVVMIGANDYWTVPEGARRGGVAARLADWGWRHSRVFRFLYLALRSRPNARLEVEVTETLPFFAGQSGVARMGDAELPLGFTADPSPPDAEIRDASLRRNLREVIAAARAGDVPLVLLTYAAGSTFYGRANEIIRQEAGAAGVALIDVALVFEPRCPEGECTLLFGDGHPTASGHALVARTVLPDLQGLLGLED